jgi:hypothetical protein
VTDAPVATVGQQILSGPERVRHELQWRVRLPDSRHAVLAQLVPELAAEPALRRRWVHDVERLAAIDTPSLAPTLAIGPQPDPRDATAEAPWRLRVEPGGRRLDDWLGADGTRRPVDEVVDVVAALADALAGLHAAGAVARDLDPRAAVLGDDGRVTLTDVGLARLGILSSRTASTLAMESSPWAAPEHLRSTIVDARADVYTLGVVLHRALTGVLPATEGIGPLRRAIAVASVRTLRPEVPDALDELVRRCLAELPDARPATAAEVADALRGRGGGALTLVLSTCQACGAALRAGMRLCLTCGREAVQVAHVRPERGGRYALVLQRVGESTEHTDALRGFFETFGERMPSLNFLIGPAQLYAKEERADLHPVPVRLLDELVEEDARMLATRVQVKGLATRVIDVVALSRRRTVVGYSIPLSIMVATAGIYLLTHGALVVGIALLLGGIFTASFAGMYVGTTEPYTRRAIGRLRAAPAALPAGDPLVARLASLLPDVRSPDVRERVAELALWLQRIADHRARAAGAAQAEIAAVLEPLSRLVDAIAAQIQALVALDRELSVLDEGALVRALAASEARGEPASRRAELLAGLDRLRGLEDQRAALMGRLLDAGALLRRAAELVLGEGAAELADAAEVARATALLEAGA